METSGKRERLQLLVDFLAERESVAFNKEFSPFHWIIKLMISDRSFFKPHGLLVTPKSIAFVSGGLTDKGGREAVYDLDALYCFFGLSDAEFELIFGNAPIDGHRSMDPKWLFDLNLSLADVIRHIKEVSQGHSIVLVDGEAFNQTVAKKMIEKFRCSLCNKLSFQLSKGVCPLCFSKSLTQNKEVDVAYSTWLRRQRQKGEAELIPFRRERRS